MKASGRKSKNFANLRNQIGNSGSQAILVASIFSPAGPIKPPTHRPRPGRVRPAGPPRNQQRKSLATSVTTPCGAACGQRAACGSPGRP